MKGYFWTKACLISFKDSKLLKTLSWPSFRAFATISSWLASNIKPLASASFFADPIAVLGWAEKRIEGKSDHPKKIKAANDHEPDAISCSFCFHRKAPMTSISENTTGVRLVCGLNK